METFDQEVLNKSEGRKIFKAFLDKEFDNPDELPRYPQLTTFI